jgi:hypothetical protein
VAQESVVYNLTGRQVTGEKEKKKKTAEYTNVNAGIEIPILRRKEDISFQTILLTAWNYAAIS